MAVKPTYHWTFREREGSTSTDSISNVAATFIRSNFEGHGRIGQAVKLNGNNARIAIPSAVCQFGTSDFTIAFGIRIMSNHGEKDMDLFGNRNVGAHGNFVAIRSNHYNNLWFEVDQDNKGTHYAIAQSQGLSLSDGKWHHLAFVRKANLIQIYFDGLLAVEAQSDTGVAAITNDAEVRLGDYTRGTPVARYEDLRIYYSALNPLDIQQLVTPYERELAHGQLEMIGTDDTAVILSADTTDLNPFVTQFKKIRLGPGTGATLYQHVDFKGQALKLYEGISNIQGTKIGGHARSVQLWSSQHDLFTGRWLLSAPNGNYLSCLDSSLVTQNARGANELFKFQYNDSYRRHQLVPTIGTEGYLTQLHIGGKTEPLIVHDEHGSEGSFSVSNGHFDHWLQIQEDGALRWTDEHKLRSFFYRAAKYADNEGQVGTLAPGEVALYEHSFYQGRAWILNDGEPGLFGKYLNLKEFPHFNDVVSSIRVGAGTGVTLFTHANFQVNETKREHEIEDHIQSTDSFSQTQMGHDRVSSLRIFRTLSPSDIFESYSTVLSQDYRYTGGELEEFSAYRTIVAFAPGTSDEVEITATDFTTIEIDDEYYEIDEVTPAIVSPNAMGRIMICTEAEGLSTPGLKFKTKTMAASEYVVLFPDREVHRKLANLEADELWNAKDAEGNPLVDQSAFTKAEIGSVQHTISRVMATVVPENEPVITKSADVDKSEFSARTSVSRSVSDATVPNPWSLNFASPASGTSAKATNPFMMSSTSSKAIWEEPVVQEDFAQLLAKSTNEDSLPDSFQSLGAAAARRTRIGSRIKDAFKKAKSVVIGFTNKVMNIVVDLGDRLVSFVLDTAEKVAVFVESILEKVIGAIQKAIEFLRFLFNWGDILDTQRYLVRSINAGFDSMKDGINSAKDAVADFVDGLQDSVEDGINQLIEALGVEPSEVEDSRSLLPESVEWFFSKLLGGSKKKGAKTSPDSPEASEESGLGGFLSRLMERFKAVADLLSIGIGGLTEAFMTIVKNPLRPELALAVLLEAARDGIIVVMEIAEDLVIDLLNVLEEAIQFFQNLLNGEIKIPFISYLFKLIGAGKLNILNLTSLLVAIPLTAISKLATGEKPFEGVPQPDFAQADEAGLILENAQLLTSSSVAALRASSAEPESENDRVKADRIRKIKAWGRVALTVDFLNGMITGVLDAFPEGEADKGNESTAGFGFEIISLLLSGISWLASFPSSPGIPGGSPYSICHHPLRNARFDRLPKEEKESLKAERVLWGWRTAVYWLDVVIVIGSVIQAASSKFKELPKIQRMKRRDEITIFAAWVFSFVDLGLSRRYLNTLDDDNLSLQEKNELAASLPNILSPLRLAGLRNAQLLGLTGVVVACTTLSWGKILLDDDLDELRGN